MEPEQEEEEQEPRPEEKENKEESSLHEEEGEKAEAGAEQEKRKAAPRDNSEKNEKKNDEEKTKERTNALRSVPGLGGFMLTVVTTRLITARRVRWADGWLTLSRLDDGDTAAAHTICCADRVSSSSVDDDRG
ncbi:unnamed protein product [Heligmosomoides polygyrus]|uniref:Prothymosin alpha n=1 Tax=Heligmosomoides polygyrus TaxID=6339 RepID=A0A183FH50_HELPZ|nr:unnamed protein product [Heligmosomoides polygyrus]